MRGRGKISVAEQFKRRRELETIGRARPLTAEEQAQADSLDHRAYMRQWRAQVADQEAQIRQRVRHG